jgi:hypothetical protein
MVHAKPHVSILDFWCRLILLMGALMDAGFSYSLEAMTPTLRTGK